MVGYHLCGEVELGVFEGLAIQHAEMPSKCLKVWLYNTPVAADKNKCIKYGRIISGKTVREKKDIK